MSEKFTLRGVTDHKPGLCTEIQEVFDRLLRLEILVESHNEELEEYKRSAQKLKESLDAIEDTLMQIKWLALGAATMLVASEIGIIQILKNLVH